VSILSCEDLVEQIWDALRVVFDPELGHNIVDLGLVYDITVGDGGSARITMTTTSMGCPAADYLRDGAANSAWSVPGIEFVDVNLTYDPQWRPDMMSPDAKADLGFAEGRN
jgi:metal-sulfur cluster biosynthetic enzyme